MHKHNLLTCASVKIAPIGSAGSGEQSAGCQLFLGSLGLRAPARRARRDASKDGPHRLVQTGNSAVATCADDLRWVATLASM